MNFNKYLLITIFTAILTSCGLNTEDEKSLIDFHEANYEFINNQKDILRHYAEKNIAEGGRFNREDKFLYANFKRLDSLASIMNHNIDSCIQQNSYDNSDELLFSYNSIIDQIDSNINEDKNYIINRFDFVNSSLGSRLKFLRIKNDIALALTKNLEYTYQYLNTSCGFNSFGDISTTSTQNGNGNITITLHSEYKDPQMLYGNFIIEDLQLNNKVVKTTDCFVTENQSFSDIKYENLKPGNYLFKGKIRYYTKKGIKDYPFDHKFEVAK